MAKNVMRSKEDTVLNQGLGVVLSGTGSKISDIVNNSNKLKKLGYETCMIYVNADLDTALHRNTKRERSVPADIVREKWNDSQKNLGQFQQSFDNFFIIDNSESSNVEIQINNVFKKIRAWCKS
jgi:tRNA uridine 5-carbamoylmethylation protein Kti12